MSIEIPSDMALPQLLQFFLSLKERFSKLQKLDIKGVPVFNSPELIYTIISSSPSLKTLFFSTPWTSIDCWKFLQEQTSFCFDSFPVDERFFERILHNCPNLKSLTVNFKSLPADRLVALSQSESIRRKLQGMQGLKEVKLLLSPSIDEDCKRQLVSLSPKVQLLSPEAPLPSPVPLTMAPSTMASIPSRARMLISVIYKIIFVVRDLFCRIFEQFRYIYYKLTDRHDISTTTIAIGQNA